MNMLRAFWLFAIIAVVLAAPLARRQVGWAACTWSWDCTSGQCKQIPLCDNPNEVPTGQPFELPPAAQPAPKAIQPYVFPPPGKQACRDAYLCTTNGQCHWKPLCE